MCNISFAVWRLTPSRLKPVLRIVRCYGRTGFSREEAGMCNISFAVWRLTPSRLKPVLRIVSRSGRTGFSREEAIWMS